MRLTSESEVNIKHHSNFKSNECPHLHEGDRCTNWENAELEIKEKVNLVFSSFSFFLFIWLCRVLVVALGIFDASCGIFHCVSQTL